jgi:hypothetical protein
MMALGTAGMPTLAILYPFNPSPFEAFRMREKFSLTPNILQI